MSKTMEFFTIYITWEFYISPCNTNETSQQNLHMNMEALDDHVNRHLAMGWQPLGPPTFSSGWLSRSNHGVAIQALIREKDVEQIAVVDVALPLVAEQVKPLRSSLRVSGQNRN